MPKSGTIPRLAGVDYAGAAIFFVTFCVKERAPVFADPEIASIARQVILDYRQAGWYWLQCYCVMPDHIHILLKLRSYDRLLSRVVATLKNRIGYLARKRGVLVDWQWGFHDRVKRSCENVEEYIQYILANPVRAGLVRLCADYPFCGTLDPWR
jgi:putative transposase